jgi:K+ transporter
MTGPFSRAAMAWSRSEFYPCHASQIQIASPSGKRRPASGVLKPNTAFMEMPDIPKLLASCMAAGCAVDLSDVTYYVGRSNIVPREDGQGLPAWQREPFAVMSRNSAHMSNYLKLPNDRLVEIGRQFPI